MIHLVVTIEVRPERVPDFLRLAIRHRDLSSREPGCVRFDLMRQGEAFALYEIWHADADLAAHRHTPHYRRWRDALPALETAHRREIYSTVRTVWTNGVFDGYELHAGHMKLLREAAEQGDFLTVAINADASARRLKGPGRPVVGDAVRAARLMALPFVGEVLLFDTEAELVDLVRDWRPDVLVKGTQYRNTVIPGAEFARSLHLVEMVPGVSTTLILEAARR